VVVHLVSMDCRSAMQLRNKDAQCSEVIANILASAHAGPAMIHGPEHHDRSSRDTAFSHRRPVLCSEDNRCRLVEITRLSNSLSVRNTQLPPISRLVRTRACGPRNIRYSSRMRNRRRWPRRACTCPRSTRRKSSRRGVGSGRFRSMNPRCSNCDYSNTKSRCICTLWWWVVEIEGC